MFFKPAYLKNAKTRRSLLKKVYAYRYRMLSKESRQELLETINAFKAAIERKDKVAILEKLMPASETLLRRVGGHYYKNYHLFENIETLVVAAILAIGVRMYFLQPFKIPTNSMWPTYHGMTYKILDNETPAPSGFGKVADLIVFGKATHEVVAPIEGELTFPILTPEERENYQTAFPYKVINKPFLGIFPRLMREYYFFVGRTPVTIDLPLEFDFSKVLMEAFFDDNKDRIPTITDGQYYSGIHLSEGQRILAFELTTGDMLFVDRISYHFGSPHIGDPIVFRTRNIAGLAKYNGGKPDDKYYIKRLVGKPGDLLYVENRVLWRNEHPISGSEIFERNAKASFGKAYRGYGNEGLLAEGKTYQVPARQFFAMGDNSDESLDSRYWGAFGKKEMVGKAVFIYYPFGERWGFSK